MALSENINARRTQLNMSQEYVADQLGISRQAVAKWEAGKSRPTAVNLVELASLFEMSISELVDPQKYAEGQQAQEQKYRDNHKNSKMLLAAGFVLLFITSKDMGKKHKLEPLQIIIGLAMIFSIFFLPRTIPLEQVGVKYLLADIVTAICGIILSLKYWRHIWRVK